MARCTNWKCARFDQTIWEEHVMSLPDTGDPDIEDDEPTQPGFSLFDHLDSKVKFTTPWVTIDEMLDRALYRCATATSGVERKAARAYHAELLRIKEEYDCMMTRIDEAIDKTVPLCYPWGDDGSEQGS
jgi:hypothetical protein